MIVEEIIDTVQRMRPRRNESMAVGNSVDPFIAVMAQGLNTLLVPRNFRRSTTNVNPLEEIKKDEKLIS